MFATCVASVADEEYKRWEAGDRELYTATKQMEDGVKKCVKDRFFWGSAWESFETRFTSASDAETAVRDEFKTARDNIATRLNAYSAPIADLAAIYAQQQIIGQLREFTPTPISCATEEEADRIFFMNNRDFLRERNSSNRCDDFDWSVEGIWGTACSVPKWAVVVPGVRTWAPAFSNACTQHDFGYFNYGSDGLDLDSSSSMKRRIDAHFKTQMIEVCGRSTTCLRTADLYYSAVAVGGGKDSFG